MNPTQNEPSKINQPKIDKSMLLSALKADYEAARILRTDWDQRIVKWVNEYEGKPYGNEVNGRSRIVSRDIKKQAEWAIPSIVDPFVSSTSIVKIAPVTAEDALSARQNEILLNTQFCRQFNRYNFMNKATRLLYTEGTLVVQTGWDYRESKEMADVPVIGIDAMGQEAVIGMERKEVTKVLKNQPTAVICRNEDIFLDPTCMDDMDKCQFVIYRYQTDLSTLKADGRYKNLDKLTGDERDPLYRPEDTSIFRFQDKPRKKLTVYEYWGNYDLNEDGVAEPIVCSWVNNTIIRLQDNPYPDNKPPFIIVPFNAVPFHMFGEANAELISDNQKVKTAITRGILDNMAQSNNGQKGLRKGALDTVNRKRFLSGENFEFNGTPNDFWDGGYNAVPGSVFDMIGLQNNEIESITGIKSFSGGISGASLGGTATGARGALDATATRRLNIVRNIAENLVKPLMRKWTAYNAEFLSDTEVVRYTNEEFVEIRRDDLTGNIDMDIEVSTAEDNAAKSQELSFLLQTLGPNEDPTIRRELMADIYELMRMPDKAEKLRKYQPQPDPIQQQIQALALQKAQLEVELLQANIHDKHARANENEVDARVKLAKAEVSVAQARKLGSEADMLDMEFLRKDAGKDVEEKMGMAEHKRLSDLDKQAAKGYFDTLKQHPLAGSLLTKPLVDKEDERSPIEEDQSAVDAMSNAFNKYQQGEM